MESRTSTRKRRQARIAAIKEAKAGQKYDDRPPSCSDCINCKRPQVVNKVYVPPFCGIGLFPVKMTGSCDNWGGLHGEKLLCPTTT
jgi:hypothetical protein